MIYITYTMAVQDFLSDIYTHSHGECRSASVFVFLLVYVYISKIPYSSGINIT